MPTSHHVTNRAFRNVLYDEYIGILIINLPMYLLLVIDIYSLDAERV